MIIITLQVIIGIILFLLALKCGYYIFTMFQQEHYDYTKLRYIFPAYFSQKLYVYAVYIILILVWFPFWYILVVGIIIGVVGLFIKEKMIIPLKFTKRVMRLLVTVLLCYAILMVLLIHVKPLFVSSLFIVLLPFVTILANFINQPIEKMVQKHYINLAKQKLNRHPQVVKVAITGSYGKTTTKNIITHVLAKRYITLATPASYNTMMGITKTINDSFHDQIEVFVCEMGAFRSGEIKEMATFIKPDIAILTEIGPQHLSTFHTLEGVKNAKFELIHSLSYDGCAILNDDNIYIKDEVIHYVHEVKRVSLKNMATEYTARNIYLSAGKTHFEIYHQEEKLMTLQTKLLGMHNVLNILLSYACIDALKSRGIVISNEIFAEAIAEMLPPAHRLSYYYQDGFHIYDDSYNSNIVGFLNAIDVLQQADTKRVIITPGIVDAGKQLSELNEVIGKKILTVFDEIYLVDNVASRYIAGVLEKAQKSFFMCKSYHQAYQLFVQNNHGINTSLLIANDLPDHYLER